MADRVVKTLRCHWTYGVVYLIAIPVFALLMARWPDDFQQSSNERTWFDLENDVRSELSGLVAAMLSSLDGDNKWLYDERRAPFIYSLSRSASNISFSAEYHHQSGGRSHSSSSHVLLWSLSFPATDAPNGTFQAPAEVIGFPWVAMRQIEDSAGGLRDFKELGPFVGDILNMPPEPGEPQYENGADSGALRGYMRLTPPQLHLLERYMRGRSSSLDGRVVRFVYLSAVTITTLGYGDVVPVSTRGRLLTAMEAILGVVLMGLFVGLAVSPGGRGGRA